MNAMLEERRVEIFVEAVGELRRRRAPVHLRFVTFFL